MKYEMFKLVEKNGHKGIFIGEVDDKPVIVTLKDTPETIMDWSDAMNYAKSQGLRLPNRRELMLMFIHKEKLNLALKKAGGEPLEESWHWSSSEYLNGYNGAWIVNFEDCNMCKTNKDYNYNCVRCVLDL